MSKSLLTTFLLNLLLALAPLVVVVQVVQITNANNPSVPQIISVTITSTPHVQFLPLSQYLFSNTSPSVTPQSPSTETATTIPTVSVTPTSTISVTPAPSPSPTATITTTEIAIPQPSDWIDQGTVILAGGEGDWDLFLWGGFATTAVKKNGLYYLYYQGANGYSEEFGTVTWRTIGVATSSDGITFEKHPANPLLEWFPNGNLEEGAVSAGATVISDTVHLFYGANTAFNSASVNADGRLATAVNGINFTDQGIFLNHIDNTIWGFGDEIFPIIAFQHEGQYIIYYIPNGVGATGQLGVAWGNDLTELQTAAALTDSQPITAWGSGGYAQIGLNKYALFINNVRENKTFVYTLTADTPQALSPLTATYTFADYNQATILLDKETQTWFMYYRNGDASRYGVKTAPVTATVP